MNKIKEFHLFAGIGGGIYGGQLLGHQCCGGVEIDKFCQSVLRQRQADGWMEKFDIFDDITKVDGKDFKGKFEVLCGGFPCQAFSHAAHGKNIAEKNLWGEMFRIAQESDAPIVFGENVTFKALDKARADLQSVGYKVQLCKLSCGDIGADHRRDRYWLLAVKDDSVFEKLAEHIQSLPKLSADCWTKSPRDIKYPEGNGDRRRQLKAVGNAQSPFVAATVFRILTNRHVAKNSEEKVFASQEEIDAVFETKKTWIMKTYGEDKGFVHTPTTMANYSCPSMMKHHGCRNYNEIFGRPMPKDAEYLMGFPIGASFPESNKKSLPEPWKIK